METVATNRRTCTVCGTTRPVEQFSRRAAVKSGRRSECKPCAAKRAQNYMLQYRFGIGRSEYLALLEAQGGRCAICSTDEPRGRHDTFQVDHCHETGRIRGLLCNGCNFALGLLGDTQGALRRAYLYVSGENS